MFSVLQFHSYWQLVAIDSLFLDIFSFFFNFDRTCEKMREIKIITQGITLPITDIKIQDQGCGGKHQLEYHKHSALLPNSVRCIICGPSNCGKTNVIMNLLESPNGLRFENVYVYAKSLFQPKYRRLNTILSSIKGIGIYMFSSNDDIVPLKDVKPNSIFIFDDVVFDKQNNIREYFCMSRHKNVDCFYLSQSYTHIPKHLIRENTNLVVLFKQDDMNLRHIYNDFSVSVDMTFDEFKTICERCWNKKYGFLVIDIECPSENGKYRMQFDKFISILPTSHNKNSH